MKVFIEVIVSEIDKLKFNPKGEVTVIISEKKEKKKMI